MSRTVAARPVPPHILVAAGLAAAGLVGTLVPASPLASLGTLIRGLATGAAAPADGGLPAGVTVSDHRYPGVTNLDPDLRAALGEAATDAAGDGIEIHVNSGWRSPAYQDRLLREAVARYGS